MTPTHVVVQQCGGGCHRAGQACSPTLTRERRVPVMLARCGIQTGQCDKECAYISIQVAINCLKYNTIHGF